MRALFAPSLLLALSVGCGQSIDSRSVVVAYLDQKPQTLTELERYFAVNLVPHDGADGEDGENIVVGDELNEVKSRLFDTFIDERLLIAEAERRQVKVSDLEIEVSLGIGRDGEELAVTQSSWRDAMRRLMIQKLQEGISRDQPPITEEQVRDYLEAQQKQLAPVRRLRLRSLMIPSETRARKFHREISRGRMTFNEAVAAHQAGPSQGVSLEVTWDNLSDIHRAALEDLAPGEVSPPVQLNGDTFLFQLESWLTDSKTSDRELIRLARADVEARRLQSAYRLLIQDLRSKVKIELLIERLPFEYVPEGRS